MPLHFALPIHLLILAAFCGLLLLHRRRLLPAALTFPASHPGGPDLACAMHAPGTADGRSPEFSPALTSTPFPPPARGELILVIDDEQSVRDLLSTVLLNHGYQVALARDGAEGLRLFSTMPDRISLVLSDVYMPNISGRSFADLIRPVRPDVRILLMSGLDGSEGGSEFDPANSRDPFLLKPFKPAALLQKIHQLLHPGPAPGS